MSGSSVHGTAMKPMLIIPPAPARWPVFQDLLGHEGAPWLSNIERRLVHGCPGSEDAYAVIPTTGQALAGAYINKFRRVGVLGHCYTRPDHRRRGYARSIVEALLSWFDMTGGQHLLLSTTAELDESLYGKFGFVPLRRAVWQPYDRLTMVRRAPGVPEDPLAASTGELSVRAVSRAEWPAMVMMLQHLPGPDPRVPLDESAVNAGAFTLDLIDHQERGASHILGAFRNDCMVALATVATDRSGERTYAMLMPHTGYPPELRSLVVDFATSKGYRHVDLPMEGLGQWHHGDPSAATAAPEARPPEH
jgi:GNAT superfamily N-acetyltransferase